MGFEIDLLKNYPKTKRDLNARASLRSPEDQKIAREFGREFFDGDRKHGYGGFSYHPRFWQPVVPDLISHFDLKPGDRVLDVGCAKGFMLYDLKLAMPELQVSGVDISDYAVSNGLESVRSQLAVANARNLPFKNDSYHVVISINTIHNLELSECKKALKEIQRVSERGSFITVDAYRTDEEKERMYQWNLTAKTILHVDDWKMVFEDVGYTGDYYWFMP